MKQLIILLLVLSMIIWSCDSSNATSQESEPSQQAGKNEYNHWEHRRVLWDSIENLSFRNTYLAVYSEIYARKESRTFPLTITVSIRNTSLKDSVFINKSEYYNTHGHLINTYFNEPIYIAPMETVEIVVEEDHEQGGSGGNFVFHWASKSEHIKPLFQAVMISASGQQGISFTTQGVDLD